MILSTSCAGTRISCPQYPLPSEKVIRAIQKVQKESPEVKAWMNRLLILCRQLGTCKVKK